jgi:tRNA A-37 threonylcarbamoyl transferase component Bud32
MSDGGAPDATDPLIGVELAGRYRIESKLGSGAMGSVYRARHVKVGRSFAVKVLHERFLADDKQAKRFQREAELAGKLHHINVVGVVDVGETDDGMHYMVMEYADGPTLGSLINGPLAPERVVSIARQLLDGLAHAHAHGLIHRDFKPENVIVEFDRGGVERPRIVDFGIAILRDQAGTPGREDRLTTAGLVLGTPHYMAPEHAVGESVDHRIDLFALGVVLYEMLTGQMPFDGDGVDVARANLLQQTPPMGIRVPSVRVDPLLEAFTRKLMEKRPDDRPATAKDARALLDLIVKDRAAAAAAMNVSLEVIGDHSIGPVPMPRPRTVPGLESADTMAVPVAVAQEAPKRRNLRALGIAGGIAAALIAVLVLALGGHDKKPETVAIATPDARGIEIAASSDAAVTSAADAAPAVTSATDAPPAVTRPPPAVVVAPVPRPLQKPRIKNAPKSPVTAAAAPDLSAASVANLYGQVGRDLKQLDTARGSGATASLWPRYLRIKINDVLTTPEKREAAHRELVALRTEILTRR